MTAVEGLDIARLLAATAEQLAGARRLLQTVEANLLPALPRPGPELRQSLQAIDLICQQMDDLGRLTTGLAACPALTGAEVGSGLLAPLHLNDLADALHRAARVPADGPEPRPLSQPEPKQGNL